MRDAVNKVKSRHTQRQPTRRCNSWRERSCVSWTEGDPDFDTPEMRAERYELRSHSKVSAALDAWWRETDTNGNGSIDREEYLSLGVAFTV